jgi:hypothetical protein
MAGNLLNVFHFAASACGTQTGRLPSLYDGLDCDNSGNINISGLSDILIIIGNVVQILLAVAGSIAIVVILVSAVMYISSAGDPGRVKKAKDILINTVIGLVIIIVSYAAVDFIAKGL